MKLANDDQGYSSGDRTVDYNGFTDSERKGKKISAGYEGSGFGRGEKAELSSESISGRPAEKAYADVRAYYSGYQQCFFLRIRQRS